MPKRENVINGVPVENLKHNHSAIAHIQRKTLSLFSGIVKRMRQSGFVAASKREQNPFATGRIIRCDGFSPRRVTEDSRLHGNDKKGVGMTYNTPSFPRAKRVGNLFQKYVGLFLKI